MKRKKNNCFEIRKSVSVEAALQSFGLRAAKSFPKGKLYSAFFREDRNPSLVVYFDNNFAFDLGRNSKKYDVIDLTKLYLNCDTKQALSYLSSLPLFEQKIDKLYQSDCEIIKVQPIFLYPLKNYLLSRGIGENQWKHVHEVHYKVPNHEIIFYSIGFKSNKENSYELRSSVFKGCSGKDITTIQNGYSKIILFEGFFDYLSFLVLYPMVQADFLIMNSTSLLNRTQNFLKQNQYEKIILMLDGDKSGSEATNKLMTEFANAKDMRNIYCPTHKDLNELLIEKLNFKNISNGKF